MFLARPVIEKWTGEEYEDMEAEFDNIDENGGGMILFKVTFLYWSIEENIPFRSFATGLFLRILISKMISIARKRLSDELRILN